MLDAVFASKCLQYEFTLDGTCKGRIVKGSMCQPDGMTADLIKTTVGGESSLCGLASLACVAFVETQVKDGVSFQYNFRIGMRCAKLCITDSSISLLASSSQR